MDRKSDFSGFVKMTEVGKVYSEFKDFLTTVQWRYSEKSHDFLCKVRTYEGDRTKYKNDCTERVKQWCLKVRNRIILKEKSEILRGCIL